MYRLVLILTTIIYSINYYNSSDYVTHRWNVFGERFQYYICTVHLELYPVYVYNIISKWFEYVVCGVYFVVKSAHVFFVIFVMCVYLIRLLL